MEKELLQWIQKQQNVLDKLIADAAADFRSKKDHANFVFDANTVSKEMWNLRNGKDLCYDRPSIGFIYSLWYHGKRINTFLRYYLNLIMQSLDESKIEVFDLGAGTGAVQWAVGIVYAALKEMGIATPRFSVINIDSSPFMLQYNEHFLWKYFVRQYPVCADIKTVYRINSWVNEEPSTASNIWLSASYLFDHSENAEEIAAEFEKLVKAFEPGKLLLLSAIGKSAYVNKVAETLGKLGFARQKFVGEFSDEVFKDSLQLVSEYRKALQQKADYGLSGDPAWNKEGLYGLVLVKKQGVFFPKDREKIDLYVTLEKDRSRIKLTAEQRKAAENKDNHVIIVGPAGCGKSVVLTQRVKNIVEDPVNPYSPHLRILVTTFNKDLVAHLGDWIEQLLDCPNKCARQTFVRNNKKEPFSWFKFKGSAQVNIYVYHLDILPTKIGAIASCDVTRNGQDIEAFHLEMLSQIAQEYAEMHKLDRKKMGKILDPVFLLEEYHRIIYGWQCSSETTYLTKERVGRGNNPTLRYNSLRRRVVWEIIYTYLSRLKTSSLSNFTMQRHRFLRKLSKPNTIEKFDYILVDEIQDCTFADYTIFQNLLKPEGNLVLAGDLAQSIHLGTSVHFPTSGFDKSRLKGSFRLPFRVSEAIKPLSQVINSEFRKRRASSETEIIYPYKGSPPGARPIIVYGRDCSQLAVKIRDIFSLYKVFGFDQLAIFENDWQLARELSSFNIHSSVEIILKSKGLEKPCVIWSTRICIDTKKDIFEFVYTILTRTTSILIIAVCETVNSKFAEVLNYLTQDKEKIVIWDEETTMQIDALRQGQFPTVDEEDQDDSEEIHNSDGPGAVSIEEL
jgi:hypothetical protein